MLGHYQILTGSGHGCKAWIGRSRNTHHIKPRSVASYLPGICSQLEPFFPDIRSHRQHWLVTKTLEGCWKMFPSATSRKRPITRSELSLISQKYAPSPSFNDALFIAILLTGFHGLLCLGELTWPNKKDLQDYCKVILWNSVHVNQKSFHFFFPGHKADCFFEGSLLIIQSTELGDDAWAPFIRYLTFCDCLFPLRAELWLKSNGTIPTHTWFGVPFHMIQVIGHWSSATFQIYICWHPVLLAALLCRSNLTPLQLSCTYHHSSPPLLFLLYFPPSLLRPISRRAQFHFRGFTGVRAFTFSAKRLPLHSEQVVRIF